jgi:hypothetical protein
MRRQGVPKSAMVCMFNTLQKAHHYVHTAFGDSDTSFRGYEIIPLHGICQGNGAGPAIWAIASTPILNMLRTANVGSFLSSPISGKLIRFSGCSFVDDTDTIQTARSNQESCIEVLEGLQTSLNIWEGGLRASGGALVPEKTTWHLSAFKWTGGNWLYCTKEDTLANL